MTDQRQQDPVRRYQGDVEDRMQTRVGRTQMESNSVSPNHIHHAERANPTIVELRRWPRRGDKLSKEPNTIPRAKKGGWPRVRIMEPRLDFLRVPERLAKRELNIL